MRSLRLQIFLAMGLLVVASVGLVGLLGHGVTRSGLSRIVELEEGRGEQADLALTETVRRDLERAWRQDSDLRQAETILDGFGRTTSGLAGAPGVAVFDLRGRLVAGSGMPSDQVDGEPLDGAEAGMVEARWALSGEGGEEVLVLRGGRPVRGADGHPVATLLTIPHPTPSSQSDRHDTLLRVDRRLLAGAVAVALLALGLGALLTRYIVRPVEALAAAARDLGAGDLGRRVEVRSRDEIGRLGQAFNDMATALERAEALRCQLVADVSHELRTPLTALRAQLEAIEDGLVSPNPDTVASLVEDASHLGRLVDDLQDLALADAGRLALEIRPLDVGDEVRAAARSLGLEPGSGLTLDLSADLPAVRADPHRLRQVLLNVLDNAHVHGASGSAWSLIEVKAGLDRDDPSWIALSVRDHGPGVAEDELARIVERFHRADASRSRRLTDDPARKSGRDGTGLGLAISKALVELHGGTLRVANAASGGVMVTVTLPAQPAGISDDDSTAQVERPHRSRLQGGATRAPSGRS